MSPKNSKLKNGENAKNEEFEELLQKIFEERQMDFREYKRTSLKRRFQKRLDANSLDSYAAYSKLLDEHPDEYLKLFEALLINVTSFFRDPEAWKALEKDIIPQIISKNKGGGTIRIWSAGCATGEEPYSIAILFSKVLGSYSKDYDIRIYATDLDEDALAQARRGVYSQEKLKNLSPKDIKKYFVPENGNYKVSRDIRKMVVFGVQNLTSDAPISHLDLIVCRNVLIYFDVSLQKKLMTRFHYALESGGFIFFGRSESMLTGSKLFAATNKRWRIFQKTPETVWGFASRKNMARVKQEENLVDLAIKEADRDLKAIDLYFQTIFQNLNNGILVVDRDKKIVAMNVAWENFWTIRAETTVGRKLFEIGLDQRLPSITEMIDDAIKMNRPFTADQKEIFNHRGNPRYLDLKVIPFQDPYTNLRGAIIISNDVTEGRENLDKLKKANDELENLNEELETTNEELVSANEELETTTEELQSTAEELETNNEELQSTNEELETTNEELRSTNEELETANDELRLKTEMLDVLNLFNTFVLDNVGEGIITVDKDGEVLAVNHNAEKIWEISGEDIVGKKPFSKTRSKNAFAQVGQKIRQTMIELEPYSDDEFEYVPHSGRKKTIKLMVIPVVDSAQEICGTILVARETNKK